MGRTACTEPQCLYNGDLYLYLRIYSLVNVTLGSGEHHVKYETVYTGLEQYLRFFSIINNIFKC